MLVLTTKLIGSNAGVGIFKGAYYLSVIGSRYQLAQGLHRLNAHWGFLHRNGPVKVVPQLVPEQHQQQCYPYQHCKRQRLFPGLYDAPPAHGAAVLEVEADAGIAP